MNQEPVAWMSQGGDVTRSKDYFEEMGFKDLIPLYTAPQGDGEVCGGCGAIRYDPICEPAPKELSDEEIWAIASEIEPIDLAYGVRLSNEWNVLYFARAILKKASEK